MTCPFEPVSPTTRLNVFISSAQNDENGFNWSEIRRQVKERLTECPYVIPFIIDAVASETPSTQLYEYQVLQADIVVMLIKGSLRPGTHTEFTVATKNNKPLLVFFLKDENPSLDVIKLRKAVQTEDYCTYHNIDTFDNIAEIVQNDVITNVIRYYQLDHFRKIKDTVSVSEVSTVAKESASRHGTPTKTSIDLFSSSYAHIFELLKIDVPDNSNTPNSQLHALGIAALDWLVIGKPMNCDTEILDLIDNLGQLYDSTDWLLKRWDAIRFELSGDTEKALVSETKALSIAKAENLPQWIINDILIDCRNIENELHNKNSELNTNSNIQKELNDLETIVYMPVLDRYLCNIYSDIAKDEFKILTASPNTVFYGTNLESIINNVENYFFSALLYGSYTHMLITRRTLSRVLYKYDELTKSSLLLDSIELLVVQGDSTQFEETLDYKWDYAYAEIVTKADKIWTLTDFATPSSKDSIKQAVIKKLGLYLTDTKFEEAQCYLEQIAPTIYWGNSENYFDSINQNMCRLNCTKVIHMLSKIIKEQRFYLGKKLSNIILQMKLDSVDTQTQNELCDSLKEQLSFIVHNGGTPQIIATLASQNQETFSILSTIPENGLIGIEKVFYDINMGNGNWNEVLTHEIETARQQFQTNRNPGVYTVFSKSPYAMIKKIIREHYLASMDDAIEHQLFPLCAEVLGSQTTVEIKNNCLDCLCDILVFNTEFKSKISQELYDAISSIEISSAITILNESKGAFACRVLMLNIICGSYNKDKLLEWCIGYDKKETKERIALAECIEQFIIQELPNGVIDATIISIVMQCFNDKYYFVRKRACNCFALLLDTKYKDLAERKLYEAAIDPSHYVRSLILNMCKDIRIKDPELRKELLGILMNDANYAIRVSL